MKTLTFTDVIRSGKHALQEVIAAVVVVWEQMEKAAKHLYLATSSSTFKMTTLINTGAMILGKHAHQQVIAAVIIVWEQMEKLAKLVIVPHNLYSFSDFLKMSS